MNKEQVLDEYYLEARSNVLDIAAFFDRLCRATGPADFRFDNFKACIPIMLDGEVDKTRRILECLSDPTTTPVDKAPGKGATGAYPGFSDRIQ